MTFLTTELVHFKMRMLLSLVTIWCEKKAKAYSLAHFIYNLTHFLLFCLFINLTHILFLALRIVMV